MWCYGESGMSEEYGWIIIVLHEWVSDCGSLGKHDYSLSPKTLIEAPYLKTNLCNKFLF